VRQREREGNVHLYFIPRDWQRERKKKKRERRKKRHNSTHTRIYGVSGGWEKEPDQTEPKVKINSTFIFSLFYFLFFTFTFTSYFLFYFFSGGYTLLLFANWGKTTKTFSCGWWVCFFFFYPFNLLRGEYQVFTTDSCLMAVSFFSRVLMMIIIIIFFFVMSCVCVFYP
jgi:hypothetical protein